MVYISRNQDFNSKPSTTEGVNHKNTPQKDLCIMKYERHSICVAIQILYNNTRKQPLVGRMGRDLRIFAV